MRRTPLAEYAAKRHAQTATRLGMSQGALSKAIREGRQIFVIESADGGISALEEKPFPGQRRSQMTNSCGDDSPAGTTPTALNVPVNSSSASEVSHG
ncbi:Cro/CI family transcriptional regulator [Ectopseudomonas khazarica]|uniref:Cro/CI family transcriptional regulator n=1 Tax=Ectopseudomonas khazarica TaxID=2502979 RepID=UPI004033D4DD